MPAKKTIQDCQDAAKKRGGRYLAKTYVNQSTPALWKCAVDAHPPFSQTYKMVLRGQWCTKCSGRERISVTRLREAAAEFGGECLSGKYRDAFSKLRWRCRNGHVFLARWNAVQQQHWCPTCGRKTTKDKLERYTQKEVLRILERRNKEGEDLGFAALRKAGLGGLTRKMAEHFGSHDLALRAAGVDPAAHRKRVENYTEQSALAVLKKLQADGHPMHLEAVQQAAPGATGFLVRHFGTYDAVLRSLGEDPEDVRRDAGTRIWVGKTFEVICEQIFAVLRPHLVFQHRVTKKQRLMIPDAVDPTTNEWWDFKASGWGVSARESIKDYAPHARRLVFICLTDSLPKSTSKIVFRSVFEFESEARTRRLKRLFAALRKLKAAKVVDRSLEAWAVRWTRDALADLIRSLPPGERNSGSVLRRYSGAAKAAQKYGGWAALVEEVTGTSPRRIHKKYEPSDLVDMVKRRLAAGQRVNPAALAQENGSLILVVDRRMGGIRKVLADHGIDYTALLKNQKAGNVGGVA